MSFLATTILVSLTTILSAILVSADTLHITNHCDHYITFHVVHASGCDLGPSGCGEPFWLSAGGGSQALPLEYHAAGGTAVKFRNEDDPSGILQFEYAVAPEQSKIYYDLSDIDGGRALEDSLVITPHGHSVGEDTCVPIVCDEGPGCAHAYQFPTDDIKMRACPMGHDLTMVYCA